MIWHSPWAFFGLIVLALVALYIFWRKDKMRASIQFSSLNIKNSSSYKTLRTRLMELPTVLKMLGLVFCIVALARPQKSDTQVKRDVEGIDIMIALDISDSMLIEDMKPLNRLESAKETLRNFVKRRTSDRIGLVVFSGEAFTMVPLTLDYELLLQRVSELTTAQDANIKQGTAIGVGLASAAGHLRESTAKSRIVIFLTDGENNSGIIDPETGLSIAKGYDIKIYSVGIGTDGPKKIPVYSRDVFGNKIKTYQPFEDAVNETLLGRFASETGGKFFRTSREDSLNSIFSEIDRLEKTKIEVNKFTRYQELFSKYLILGMILYVIGWLLSLTWLRRVPA
jgi:Ca-activated chloride channel homolog